MQEKAIDALRSLWGRFVYHFDWRDIALVVVLLGLAMFSFRPDPVLAGNMWGDNDEFTFPALHAYQGKGFVDIYNGSKYPPNHSFGLPMLMVIAYAITGPYIGNAIYAVFASALGCVVLVYILGKLLFNDRLAAFVACLFLITSELFRFIAVNTLTETTTTCVYLLVIAVLLVLIRDARSQLWKWFALGFIVGFGMCVHPVNSLVLLPVGWFVLADWRHQEGWLWKAGLLAVGVACWVGVYFAANYLYTGDLFRTERMVRASWPYDLPSGGFGWRYMLSIPKEFPQPTAVFGGVSGNFDRTVMRAFWQWSLEDIANPNKRVFYYGADVLALIGLIVAGARARVQRGYHDFLLLFFLFSIPVIIIFTCISLGCGDRFLLRLIPFVCLLNGLGFSTLLTTKSIALPRIVRGILMVPLVAAGSVYMLAHPFDEPLRYYPTTAFAQYANTVIQEDDAIIIGNMQAPHIDEFLIEGTRRIYVPFFFGVVADHAWVQWKKPPHPEWIPEWVDTGRYPRMFENGALPIYQYSAEDNPEVIDAWLEQGRKVYVMWLSVFVPRNQQVLQSLANRYRFEVIRDGFPLSRIPPKDIQDQFNGYHPYIARLLPRTTATYGSKFLITVTPTGETQFQTAP